MVNSTEARYGIDSYLDWVEREGLIVHEGVSADLLTIQTAHWPRYGVNGAVLHLRGADDFGNLFAIEIPPGGATLPQRHLYDEVIYVIEGTGSTALEFADGSRRSFEWGPNSLFAIPLNAKHRHFNGSGSRRSLIASTTALPLVMKTFHNDQFIFDNDFAFPERIGDEKFFAGEGNLSMHRPGNNIWETNFIHDLTALELTAWADRGAGATSLAFSLADSIMHAHVSEVAVGTYKKAHRHGGGRFVFTVTGTGYSLLWFEGDADFTRVDWKPGVVFPPIEKQFHQHFVTSPKPSRYLATGVSSIRYPLTQAHRRVAIGEPGKKQGVSRSVKEGGSQIEYADQDPRIHEIWLEELRKNGLTSQFDKYETT